MVRNGGVLDVASEEHKPERSLRRYKQNGERSLDYDTSCWALSSSHYLLSRLEFLEA